MTEYLRLEVPTAGEPEDSFWAAVDALATELGLAVSPVEVIAKAAGQPHPSQFQHRTAGGKFARTSPAVLHRLTAPEREEAKKAAGQLQAEELAPRLSGHLGDFTTGGITADIWFARCAKDIRYFYGELFRWGKRAAGDPAILLSPQDRAILNRLVEDELKYLARFREDLDAGKGVMPYPERMALYARAAWEAYWLGWTMGDLRPGRQVRWRWGQTEEHCGDCRRFVELGWTDAATFVALVLAKGYAPRSGMLECKGVRCDCWLEDRQLGDFQPEYQVSPYVGAAAGGDVTPRSIYTGVTDAPSPVTIPGDPPSRFPAAPVTVSGEDPEAPIDSAEAARASDGPLALAVTALLALALPSGQEERVLRDAASYLYLNARDRVAAGGDPARVARALAAWDRAADWLADRYRLPLTAAEEAVRIAGRAGIYRTSGDAARWVTTRWPEPKLADYPDLAKLYGQAKD